MEIRIFRLRLPLRKAFRIAHGSYAYRENLFLELREGEAAGLGEAPIVPYYGLSIDEVEADLGRGLRGFQSALLSGAIHSGAIHSGAAHSGAASSGAAAIAAAAAFARFAHPVSAAAFHSAFLSLCAALEGRSPSELLGIEAGERGAAAPATSYTIAYDDDPEAMLAVARASGFRRLKVKAGIPGDLERIRRLREGLPEAILRVDANQGWSLKEAPAKLYELERLGVELVEEPVAGSPADYESLARATSLPLLLDESARSLEDIGRYAREAPSLAGLVVKTAKNGGPAASLAVMRAARGLGLKVMLSSMVETSLGVGSALPLAPLCAWCDLDSPLLLAEDPFVGLSYEDESPRLSPGGLRPGGELASYLAGLPPLFPQG